MTGKQQKAKAVTEDFVNRVKLTMEEKTAIIDEAVIEVHSQNEDFLNSFKLPIKAFRGMYIVHTLWRMIDKLVEEKTQKKLVEKVEQYKKEEDLKKRR